MAATNLDLRLDALRGKDELPASAVEAFRGFLLGAPDVALFRMSPLRYAAAHGLTEQQGIDLFLLATHAGILEFAWGVLCPGCMAFLTTPGGLRSLGTRRCNFCRIDAEGSMDDRVEVAFTVAPTARRIRFHAPDALELREDVLRLFFSSSLAVDSAPHRALEDGVLLTGRAPPGLVSEVSVTLAEGLAVLLAPASHAVTYLRAGATSDAPRAASIDLLDGCAIPDFVDVAAGPIQLSLRNRTAQTMGYLLASVHVSAWPSPAQDGQPLGYVCQPYLSGARLIASQAFRDLFRAESIPSEGGLELKAVTVLFTDLKGSTAIYERVGDLRAYDLVRRHFAVLRAIAAAEGGAIVKTIGDAVMASFADPLGAMRAAARMNEAIARLGEGDLLLKIGLHSGPCIAVDLNDRLDYFGRTVNLAARVQGIAEAGEIVCTEAVYGAPGVREAIAAAGLGVTRGAVSLRGIAGEVPVVRLAPAGA